MNTLGIDKLTPLAGFTGELISSVATLDENQDGQIQLMEIGNKIQIIAFKAFGTFRGLNLKDIKAQASDIDNKELSQLVDAFAKKFDLRKDEAEWLIEDWLRFLGQGAALVARTKKVFFNKKETTN